MSGRLEGKVALITGAGQGSGRGCALALADAGAAVVAAGRTESKLVGTAQEIERRGGRAVAAVCDVMDPGQVRACVQRAVSEFGTVDILVNAAQSPMMRSAPILDVERDALNQLWASGPVATIDFMRECHPYLKGGGSVINFGTGAQWVPKGFGAYAGAKAAIGMITRAAAEEWGPDGIRVNLVVPFVESPAFNDEFEGDDARLEAIVSTIPLRRLGDAERDLGRAVVFLASEDAGYITGTTLMVDGGGQFLR